MSLGKFRYLPRIRDAVKGVFSNDDIANLEQRDRQIEDYLSAVGDLKDRLDALTGLITGDGQGGFTATALPVYSSHSAWPYVNVTQGNGSHNTYTWTWGSEGSPRLIWASSVLTFGSTSSVTGNIGFTLPYATITTAELNLRMLVDARVRDASTGTIHPLTAYTSATQVDVYTFQAGVGTNAYGVATSSTNPMTWATGDKLILNVLYLD